MYTVLIYLNVLSALVVAVHCCCRLSVRQWDKRSMEMWAHALLVGGAVGVIGSSLNADYPHHPTEVLSNFGMAAYLSVQSWRLWVAKNRKMNGQ